MRSETLEAEAGMVHAAYVVGVDIVKMVTATRFEVGDSKYERKGGEGLCADFLGDFQETTLYLPILLFPPMPCIAPCFTQIPDC
jgi:hypothetical protein